MKTPKFRKPDEIDNEKKTTVSLRIRESDLKTVQKAAQKHKLTVSAILSSAIEDYVRWLKEQK